ncbi:carbonic anhydrase [Bacillus sp. RG28]|uniref:carbonic anhydrase n=1 Tax=Gottfriedia endophytica TaxID=2820819 RepID=A0A940NMD3_9BACI|nr:carbonic anhydrase [Gottfriedia endophytica]MBP0726942.1 carbonic anhydrase [Gottfriedia endophytica]
MINEILDYNKRFVENKEYEPYIATKFPDKQMAIVTCMDTRLIELLPKALNLKNGDAKIIKTAGGIISHPFGSVMRSLLISIYELGVKEVFVIGHHQCGMSATNPKNVQKKMIDAGIPEENLELLKFAGINLDKFLVGFDDVGESVKHSVSIIRNHPLIPKHIPVHGLVIDPLTGKLDVVDKDLSSEL